jgi:hypothetical protein
LHAVRNRHGAQRNATLVHAAPTPDFASLHPGYVLPIHHVKQPSFFIPGSFCVRVLRFPFRTFVVSDPRPRGWRSTGRRYPLSCRAPTRATPRLRSVGRPAQTGRRLAALHRDGFGPAPRSAPELPPASFARATPAAGIASGQPRVPNLPGTVYGPRPGRHLPLHFQETLLESAPHERDFGFIA